MTHLGHNRYGKSGIRLVTVTREGQRHTLSDLTIDVWLEGNFDAAYLDADNAPVLPTDTMRGTVYALARDEPPLVMEAFALRLARHFCKQVEHASLVEVRTTASGWDRIGGHHDHAFTRGPSASHTVTVQVTDDDTHVTGGIEELVLLKSAHSAFFGFMIDEFTTLAETDDRILATALTGSWGFRDADDRDWSATAASVKRTLETTFADHDSQSAQHTLYAMGQAVLDACGDLAWVRLSMPNLHHVPVDLSGYRRDNPNQVFVATDRPFGAIEATVVADEE